MRTFSGILKHLLVSFEPQSEYIHITFSANFQATDAPWSVHILDGHLHVTSWVYPYSRITWRCPSGIWIHPWRDMQMPIEDMTTPGCVCSLEIGRKSDMNVLGLRFKWHQMFQYSGKDVHFLQRVYTLKDCKYFFPCSIPRIPTGRSLNRLCQACLRYDIIVWQRLFDERGIFVFLYSWKLLKTSKNISLKNKYFTQK